MSAFTRKSTAPGSLESYSSTTGAHAPPAKKQKLTEDEAAHLQAELAEQKRLNTLNRALWTRKPCREHNPDVDSIGMYLNFMLLSIVVMIGIRNRSIFDELETNRYPFLGLMLGVLQYESSLSTDGV
jgi:hypothetical protein